MNWVWVLGIIKHILRDYLRCNLRALALTLSIVLRQSARILSRLFGRPVFTYGHYLPRSTCSRTQTSHSRASSDLLWFFEQRARCALLQTMRYGITCELYSYPYNSQALWGASLASYRDFLKSTRLITVYFSRLVHSHAKTSHSRASSDLLWFFEQRTRCALLQTMRILTT